jgi:hypothetical protein
MSLYGEKGKITEEDEMVINIDFIKDLLDFL